MLMAYRSSNATRYDRQSPRFNAGAHKHWQGRSRLECEHLLNQDRQYLDMAREHRGKNTPAEFRGRPIPSYQSYAD